ncbi:sodium-independent sulfate anion transporter-like isoform X2 [Bacillus rossius redtenbacheri]|uniref:sodium-independent sulfate anion transporter-like isoform X2 n=1 Tax=Bacillus rossius redtenbacheri TaxID=93214 RepID=UPI002FDE30AA
MSMLPLLSRVLSPGALARRVPVLAWLPRYSLEDAVSDLVAGVTVGLTLMPQAIAYAALAGLGPQYGLYSAFAGSFVYILFGTCKEVNIGPTALISLLTFNYTHGSNPDLAVLLCFLSGCVELLCGLLHLGFLMELVSVPVVSGFTSAAALIIASSQLKGLLGLRYSAESFVEAWRQLFLNISSIRLPDLALSACCVTALLLLRKLKDVRPGGKNQSRRQKVLGKVLFFVSTGRNAMVVVVCAAAAYFFSTRGTPPFLLTGRIQPGLPPVAPPPFSTAVGNTTLGFLDMCRQLGSGIGVVPVVSILGNVAIAKAFTTGMRLDATQEMITLGLCNIAGSFVRSMPVTGSFSRSAVNNASGVRTPMGGLYTGILIVLALSLLTPYFYFIPRATLSSVIICAVIFMVEVSTVSALWKTSKRDLVPALVTFVACLGLGVEVGILVGIAVDVCFLVYFNARPKVAVERAVCPGGPEYLLVTPAGGLLFPAAEFLRDAVAAAGGSDQAVVLSCRHVQRLDFTAAQGVASIARDLAAQGRRLVLGDVAPEVARTVAAAAPPGLLALASDELQLWDLLRGWSLELPGGHGRPDAKLDLGSVETPELDHTRV